MYITYPNNFQISPEMNLHFDDVKLPPFIKRNCNQCRFLGKILPKCKPKELQSPYQANFFFEWYFHPIEFIV
jgi:hypothetical protein